MFKPRAFLKDPFGSYLLRPLLEAFCSMTSIDSRSSCLTKHVSGWDMPTDLDKLIGILGSVLFTKIDSMIDGKRESLTAALNLHSLSRWSFQIRPFLFFGKRPTRLCFDIFHSLPTVRSPHLLVLRIGVQYTNSLV